MSKVISLWEKRVEKNKKDRQEMKKINDQISTQEMFDDAVKRNEENRKRMMQERLRQNRELVKWWDL